MRKVIQAMVMVLATMVAVAQTQPSQGQPANQVVIKDPGEYNAYMSAFNMQDPVQKAAAMESFIKQYPSSVVKRDALEQLLAAYDAAKNLAKVEETATRILSDNPNNVQALAIETTFQRAKGTPQSIADAGAAAQKGLQALSAWTKPEGMSDADFEKATSRMTEIFNGAAGFAALQAKDYAAASAFYVKSIAKDPNNLQDIYPLAVAYLEMTPINLDGFWYGARALSLAAGMPDTVKAIAPYVKAKYKKYHGKVDDWDKFAATVAGQTAPPADMAALIPPAPTPCDFAVQAVKDNKPEDLSFSDWEFVLSHANCSPANKDAADKVWQAILNKQKTADGTEAKLKLPVLVIKATPDTVQAAITDENQQAKIADITVTLEKPALHPPAAGTTIDVVGNITKYASEPFMFTMEQGVLPPAKPATPNRRPVHRAANQKPAR
ncbi:MAG TPA: hypothetical protein VI685_13325 [Candidatus Angelobacter sp.]